jgi:hypothetical protein
MPEAQDTDGRPCLHRMMVELIEDFFVEYPQRPVSQTQSTLTK